MADYNGEKKMMDSGSTGKTLSNTTDAGKVSYGPGSPWATESMKYGASFPAGPSKPAGSSKADASSKMTGKGY